MSRRIFSMLAAATMGFCLMSQSAAAENRIALVIGNSAYRTVGQLENPVNDATAMTRVLASAGFEVISATNLTQDDMRRAIRDFSAKVSQKGEDSVALVFYAGHGLQVEGENFLVPVDARIERESDVSIEALRLADLMKALESAPVRTRIVILDACRNNPFAAIQKTTGRGLAIVDAPTSSIVAYATAPGAEALDGTGLNSPYSAALVEAIKEPGLQIEQLFKRVRLKVHKATDGRQTPWESSSLTSNFAFFNAANTAIAAASKEADKPVVVASVDPQPVGLVRTSRLEQVRALPVERAYDVVIEEDSVEYYEEFVRLYPTHPLCDRIRRILFRRNQMVAWRNATISNTGDAYAAYLTRYPHSDHSASAIKLQIQPRLRPIDPIFTRLPKLPSQGNGQLGNVKPGGFPATGQNNGAGQANNGRPAGLPLPGQGNNGLGQAKNGQGQANNGNKVGGIQVPGQNNGAASANNGRPGSILVPAQATGAATLPNTNNGAASANNGRPGSIQVPGQATGTATLPNPSNGASQVGTVKPGTIQVPGQANTPSQITTVKPGTISPTSAVNAPSQITTVAPRTVPPTGPNNAASQITTVRPGTIPSNAVAQTNRLPANGVNPNLGNAGAASRIVGGPAAAQPRLTAPVTQPRFTAPVAQPRISGPVGGASPGSGPSRQFTGGLGRRI